MILMTIYCRWYNIKWSKALELGDLECDISSKSTPFNNRVPLKPSFRCLENDFTLNSNLECDTSRYSTHSNNGIPLKPSFMCLENDCNLEINYPNRLEIQVSRLCINNML